MGCSTCARRAAVRSPILTAASAKRSSRRFSAAAASAKAMPVSPQDMPSQVSGGMLNSLSAKTSCAMGSSTRRAVCVYSGFSSIRAAWVRASAAPVEPVYRSMPRTSVFHRLRCCCHRPGVGASQVQASSSLPPGWFVAVRWSAIASQSSRSCCTLCLFDSSSADASASMRSGG